MNILYCKTSFQALKIDLEKNGRTLNDVELNGYSNKELFFISFAQVSFI